MNTTREKFIELLKNNEFDKNNLTADEAKELIAKNYSFITKYDMSIYMTSFDENDKFIFGESAICTGDISEFMAEHDEDWEITDTYEYLDNDDEPMFAIDKIVICKDIVIINGYSTIGDDCSFVLYKKY